MIEVQTEKKLEMKKSISLLKIKAQDKEEELNRSIKEMINL